MCAAVFRGVDPDAAAAVSLPTGKINSAIQFSMLSALPRPLQLAKVLLVVTTGVKSAACRMGGWHFTESLHSTPERGTKRCWAEYNSNGRFYAESNKRLGMTPTEFKAGGGGATIRFAAGECSLGSILVAASDLGICSIA